MINPCIQSSDMAFFLKGKKTGEFIAAIAYHIQDDTIYGAFYGYAGGGVYDGGFFKIHSNQQEFLILGYDDAEQDANSKLFYTLMGQCGDMSNDQDDDPSMLSSKGKYFLENAEVLEDNELFITLNNFDPDLISIVSTQWNISLRFNI